MAIDPKVAIADAEEVLKYQGQVGGRESIARMAACIARLAPSGSEYRKMADGVEKFPLASMSKTESALRGIVGALRRDYELGRVADFEALVHASLFDDFLEQALALRKEGYRLPAAVLIGATLEEHLRKMAGRNSVPTTYVDKQGATQPKKASTLNTDLAQANVYSKAEHSQILSWLQIRNDAAHGDPDFLKKHADDDVRRMGEGVRDFILKYPA
jgi:hypothetical protein